MGWHDGPRQGFGFLEGGRGMVSVAIGAIGLIVFSFFLDNQIGDVTFENRRRAFQYVIWSSSIIVIITGALVYFFMGNNDEYAHDELNSNRGVFKDIKAVLHLPSVWWLMIIILCAYVGYKLTDIFSLYAKEIMGFNEVEAAQIGVFHFLYDQLYVLQ